MIDLLGHETRRISSLNPNKTTACLADYFISDLSKIEIEEVVKRLTLNLKDLKNLVHQSLKLDDAHIIAGTKKAKFLITYNLRHFKIDKIKADLGIIILTPADFLQYLRSQ